MKRGFLLLWALVLFVWGVSAQSVEERLTALAGIEEVKPLPAGEFEAKYEVMLRQPLDLRDPEAGSFLQRVIVMHAGYDRPTMLITQGYGAGFALRENYREEISRMFDMNMIFVEHRYFDRSMPDPCDWQYLTARNSADDLHAIRRLFDTLYPGKWLASGISKGGTTTMLYATFYPGDVDIYVPYVGPVCTSREDKRFAPFFARISTPEDRAAVAAFQQALLERRAELFPLFGNICREQGLTFRLPMEEIYDYCVLEFSFAFWQWGPGIETIPASDAPADEVMAYWFSCAGPDYFAEGGANASFFVQAARELGYYPYDPKPFRKLLTVKTTKDYLRRIFIPEELRRVKFDRTLCRKMTKYLRENDPKMLLVYGGTDPWTAPGAGWVADLKKENMKVYVQPGGSHRTRISTLPDAMREEAFETLRRWLED